MKITLVDTGPLVALIDADDGDHQRCVEASRRLRSALFTTWPVLTEAMYLLSGGPAGQDALLSVVENGDVTVADLDAGDVPVLRALLRRYRDLPMDFADASLVCVAQRERILQVFTLDRDFSVYRVGRRPFVTLP